MQGWCTQPLIMLYMYDCGYCDRLHRHRERDGNRRATKNIRVTVEDLIPEGTNMCESTHDQYYITLIHTYHK